MKLCPFCEQDVVWLVRLRSAPHVEFKMCFECDSVWKPGQEITNQGGTTFEAHMKDLGLIPDWADIEKGAAMI
jgi:hypothetical protein